MIPRRLETALLYGLASATGLDGPEVIVRAHPLNDPFAGIRIDEARPKTGPGCRGAKKRREKRRKKRQMAKASRR